MKQKTGTRKSRTGLCKNSSKRSRTGLITSCCLLLLALSTVLAGAAPAKQEPPPPLVMVSTVAEQEVNPAVEYVGHVEAVQEVDLQARVSGLLEQVNFKEGSDVRVGDLLYVIEQAPYQARVNAAQARMNKAQVALTRARDYLQRIQNVRSGGVSATDIESGEADVKAAEAELQETKAALALAELDLGYTRISAPISGRIGATALTKGNLCGPASGPLARIVQLDPIRVRYSVSENDLAAVKMALDDSSSKQKKSLLQPQIRLPGGKLLGLSGKVDFVDNKVDANTGTISVRLIFDNPEGLLLPGQYVTALLSRKQARLMPMIPQAAILEDREGRYVLVVDAQSQVEQRRVKTGAISGQQWAIESGLVSGEVVIVQGVQKVRPGQTVKTTTVDAAQGN